MIDKLNELKGISEEIIGYNNLLRKISSKITKPKVLKAITSAYLIILILVFLLSVTRFFMLPHSSNYNIIQLVFGSFITSIFSSLIIIAILVLPIIIAIHFLKRRKFLKYQPEIISTLKRINDIYVSLNNYPTILYDYLNVFYLDKLIEYIKIDDISVEFAVNKLEEEKRTNRKIATKVKIAEKRISIIESLFKLSATKDVSKNHKTWVENYTL